MEFSYNINYLTNDDLLLINGGSFESVVLGSLGVAAGAYSIYRNVKLIGTATAIGGPVAGACVGGLVLIAGVYTILT